MMNTPAARAAREQMYAEGLRPVVPLADGNDLWADDDGLVYAYTLGGKVLVVMLREQYDEERRKMSGQNRTSRGVS